MKNIFEKVMYEELLNERLNKFIYPFRSSCILDNNVINKCEIIELKDKFYLIKKDKDGFISSDIHKIRTKFKIIRVNLVDEEFGLKIFERI